MSINRSSTTINSYKANRVVKPADASWIFYADLPYTGQHRGRSLIQLARQHVQIHAWLAACELVESDDYQWSQDGSLYTVNSGLDALVTIPHAIRFTNAETATVFKLTFACTGVKL